MAKSPEGIMRGAIMSVACAFLRQNGVSDTFVAECAHDKLPHHALESLNLECVNLVRSALGMNLMSIADYDDGIYLEWLR